MKRLFFVLIFLVLGSIYWATAARFNVGFGDADEILTSAYLRSVAHPSGYALTVQFANWFMRLPIEGTMAFRANMLALVSVSLGLAVQGLIGVYLWEEIERKHTSQLPGYVKIGLLGLGIMIVGLSALLWLYAGVLEVGALNVLFSSLAILSVLYWRRGYTAGKNTSWWCLMGAAVCSGLGLANVHTFILLAPGLGILVLGSLWEKRQTVSKRDWSWVGGALGIFILCFILPNLLLFIFNDTHQPVSWAFESNWQGWWRILSRRDYSGFIPEQSRSVSAYVAGHSFFHYWNGFNAYWKFIVEHFGTAGLLLGILGIVWSRRYLEHVVWLGMLGLWGVSGLVLAVYMGVPDPDPSNLEYRVNIGISHRQYLLGEQMWGLFILLGIVAIVSILNGYFKKQQIAIWITTGMLVVICGVLYTENHAMADQRNNRVANDYARVMLDSAAPDSVIICFSDISCFSLFYTHFVEHVRPDVTVLIKNNYYQAYFLQEHPEFRGYAYGENPYFTADLISWNVNSRTTYITEPDGFYIQYVGLDGDPYYLIPEGYLYRVTTIVPQTAPVQDLSVSRELLSMNIPEKHYFERGLRDYFAHKHTVNGVILSKMGLKDASREQFEMAISLNPAYPEPRQFIGDLALYPGEPRYAPGTTSPTADTLFSEYESFLAQAQTTKDNDLLNKAYSTLLKTTFRDPTAVKPRLALAKMYLEGGYLQESRMTLKHLLSYDPNNAEAQALLLQTQQTP